MELLGTTRTVRSGPRDAGLLHPPLSHLRAEILPDSTLISMASGDDEPYYSISFISYNRRQERDGFFMFADVLAQTTARLFHARPHWGKVCPIDSQLVDQLYPRLAEFQQVCDAMDPGGVFRNRWVEDLVFDGSVTNAGMQNG